MSQIDEIRGALLGQINRLQDPSLNIEKEVLRSNAIVDVCKTMVETIKVEIDFMKVSGSGGTGVIPYSSRPVIETSSTKQLNDGSAR